LDEYLVVHKSGHYSIVLSVITMLFLFVGYSLC